MDFATQLDMVSMYADAHSRLIAYRFKFNLLLSVNDPHYGQNKFTDVLYCYLLVQVVYDDS